MDLNCIHFITVVGDATLSLGWVFPLFFIYSLEGIMYLSI